MAGDQPREAGTTRPGLTPAEVAQSRSQNGSNDLPHAKPTPLWRRLVRELTHFFALLLWAAALLALVAGLPELSVAIVLVIVINALFAFAQERRAERAAASLLDLVPRSVLVIRSGERLSIPARELVVGDVVLLDAGDRVPADGVVLAANTCELNTSLITGESVPSDIDAGDPVTGGTFVVNGDATVMVNAVGAQTRLAGIAQLTESVVRPRSPLEHEMRRVVRTISAIAVSVGVVFLAGAVVVGVPLQDAATFAIGVSVALVPEALLPTVTLSLALGAQRIARRHAIVRHLESVETLGSVTFICTDKTGTLTRNQMQVTRVWTPAGEVTIDGEGYEPTAQATGSADAVSATRGVAQAALSSSRGRAVETGGTWTAQGDPMEAAIDALSRRVQADPPVPAARTFAFDATRRRMSAVCGSDLFLKGAPDAVFPVLRDDPGPAADAVVTMASAGLRVLAVAMRKVEDVPATAEQAEHDLTLLGLLGFADPPRPDAHAAIDACRSAGIAVAMITGDHLATASSVAAEVGLTHPDSPHLNARDLPHDEGALAQAVDHDGTVLARVEPEQKLAIARALQRRGHIVAMTGDGVNDGPALQEADIGVAMGASGSDVAREASDLVLLDDDFTTIVATVEQGRGTFLNVRRFLTYHLTDNVAELFPLVAWAMSGGSIPLALGVLQILALDLATDTMTAVALGGERPHDRVMSRPPVSGRLLNRRVAWRAFGLLGPTEALLGMTAFMVVLLSGGWRLGSNVDAALVASASGAYFITVVCAQAANAFACRSSTLAPWRLGFAGTRMLVWSVLLALAVGVASLFVPPIADLLGQANPSLPGWFVAAFAPTVLLAVDAADKAVRQRQRSGDRVKSGPPDDPDEPGSALGDDPAEDSVHESG